MKNLKLFRLKRNMTQTALGRLNGVSQAQISALEKTEQSPRLDTVTRLAAALGCKLDDLVEERTVSREPAISKDAHLLPV